MEPSINKQLRELRKRERQSIGHYLKSIDHDSTFVAEVVGLYHTYPAYANLRCGRWYAPRSHWSGMAHFKSTDGHTGRWAFSSTRMNLHFACAASKAGGEFMRTFVSVCTRACDLAVSNRGRSETRCTTN